MARPLPSQRLVVGLVSSLLVVGCSAWLLRPRTTVQGWRTGAVATGDVVQHIKATGTLNALVQVPVGTQVSGVVTALYADFNSRVRKGQVVALIDPTLAQAQLAEAAAGLKRAKAALDNARQDLKRYRELASASLVSATDLEARELAFQTAEANHASAKAALDRAQVNLGYCTITAPVDGVVVSRVVDVGQTVAASFSTPSLFSVAQDLSRMKLQVAIDEADIGHVEVGQPATFTVDAYPGRTFEGRVCEVQLNPTVTSNVVTYQVVLEVANAPRAVTRTAPVADGRGTARYLPAGSPVYQGDNALMPGMTAHVSIQTQMRKGVLKVPNMALRFQPEGQSAPPGDTLWIQEGGRLRPLPVKAGISDGQNTEVSGPGLQAGLPVILGQEAAKAVEAKAPMTGGPGGPPPPR